MEITDVRMKLIRDASDRLKAVCTITFDSEFVVRDVKIVEGTSGLFVAMPSRKLSVSCHKCRHKNHLRARFCNECGAKLTVHDSPPDADGRTRLHRDVAHPITTAFREAMQQHVIEAYQAEVERSQDPDYEPAEDVEISSEDNEYSTLISELRGGSTESRGRRGRRDGSGGGEQRGRRGSRGRRRESGRSERGQEESQDADGAKEPDTRSCPEDEGVSDEAPRKERPPRTRGTAPAAEPVADAVALDEAEAPPPAGEDGEESSDDTAAFGVGLL